MSVTRSRRERSSWWRSRRAVALVVIIDLLGGAALAYALTRGSPSTPVRQASTDAAVVAAPRPQDPLTQTVGQPTTTAAVSTAAKPAAHPRPRPAPSATFGPADAATSFQSFVAGQPGAVGLAIAPLGDGSILTFGQLQVGHGWSTMKVPVLTTVLREFEQRGTQLDGQAQADATRALEASDNAAAEDLFAGLEGSNGGLVGASAAVQDTLGAAGDTSTVVNTAPNSGGFTTWGQTEWPASGEVTFYRALARGCLLSSTDTRYVLGLMGNVESDQRWGAGSAGLPQPLMFKGGWGPEDGAGYLVRQTAIVGSGTRGYVFSMLARPSDGAFGTGTSMLTQTAGWVARTFPANLTAPAAGC